MSFLSKDRFEAMQTKLAASYNVKTVTEMFNLEVPKAVALINAVQQSIAFLQMVSIINVTDTKGDIVTLHAPTSIAGRTDTTSADKERVAQVVGNKTARTYETVQDARNSPTANITNRTTSTWSKSTGANMARSRSKPPEPAFRTGPRGKPSMCPR